MKTALITGASRGIGAACARALAARDCRVIINFRQSADAAGALAEELGGAAVRADVSDSGAVDAMMAEHRPDILICNAGISKTGLIQDTTDADWGALLGVNVSGAFYCCRAAAPHMIRRGGGRIILISSIWGIAGASCEAAYSATKAALIGLTKALAKELGPSGITVNCIAPGVIGTDMNAGHSAQTLAALAGETPLSRLGTPEDVAELAAYLASDGAGFVTGQVIAADGGFIL